MTVQSTHAAAVSQMTEACSNFLNSLNSDQKAKTVYSYLDGERIFWYYPPLNRHGLPLREMDAKQRQLAYAVMASGLTDKSYEQAKLIIEHEDILGPLEVEQDKVTFLRDTERYYFTIFGEPGGSDPWGWRVEGHHVCLNYSIWNDKVIAVTPFFFGANPAEVRKGPKNGLRILGDREDLAFELMESLDAGQQSKAIIYDEAPLDILTYNSSKVSLPREEGLPASRMSGTQQEMLMALVTLYVSQVRSDVAQERLDAFKTDGIDGIHLAWAGPVDKSKAHYYRLHGGDFLVEFDNRQDGANHIHSVYRDVENDFASDVLRQHLLLYHVL
ncbi:MAG TPA: DUF3500 domain-containing protein [Dehalococcoidia bacterium]|jgi:hypothetical protein|nr:DUF3500 domain-containing protein [Dehalococcoidia bacterium]MEE2926626.1 DUF3500 domain-containing protein [Chloroflexota bacterium]HIB12810.1 DUF3500 domain-containing protein [Dehalococcoidia bacterium]HIM47908.1 DUF3500 domain-containing protein [Dehalococcoidia bacterium]|tara:strand:+ start:512 stop:1498 length:987 start_codon:yes stop_codon:yes gene_type:complete